MAPVSDKAQDANAESKDKTVDISPVAVQGIHNAPYAKPMAVRYSIQELERRYNSGDKKPLEDVLRAWHGLTNPTHPRKENPFFILGGYHGEPFVTREDAGDRTYWGGYCDHGNVLFPTWHRAYLYKLEKALQEVVPGVGLPFFDETSNDAMTRGVPTILTKTHVELDGKLIKNPIRSFILPEAVEDNTPGDPNNLYTKPKGYETVRFPFSGLVGTEKDRKRTEKHNAQFTEETGAWWLNKNFLSWMYGNEDSDKNDPQSVLNFKNVERRFNGVYHQFVNCLKAPNYTVFSNTTSSAEWNRTHDTNISLEQPHNDVHLAIGGFWYGRQHFGIVAGANGDMGENNTAGLDPIFFFHHANVDRMFWQWQKRHGLTKELSIYQDWNKYPDGYPGTNTAHIGQGPRTGEEFNQVLTLESALNPFKFKPDGDKERLMTSNDVVDIESQLGYTYGPGSLDLLTPATSAIDKLSERIAKMPKIHVEGIARTKFRGSFVIYAEVILGKDDSGNDKTMFLGHYSVLNRWNPEGCANCQNHIGINAFFPLFGEALDFYKKNPDNLGCKLTFGARDSNTRMKVPIEASVSDFKFTILPTQTSSLGASKLAGQS